MENWIYKKRGKSIRSGKYVEKCKKNFLNKQKLILRVIIHDDICRILTVHECYLKTWIHIAKL